MQKKRGDLRIRHDGLCLRQLRGGARLAQLLDRRPGTADEGNPIAQGPVKAGHAKRSHMFALSWG